MEATKIAIFKGKKVRKLIYQKEWWFSVIDVVEALTGTDRPRKYWNDLKKKLAKEGYPEVSKKIGQLNSTTEIAKNKNTQGFNQNKTAAIEGGSVAGNARRDLERKSGKKVSTRQNYLTTAQNRTLLP